MIILPKKQLNKINKFLQAKIITILLIKNKRKKRKKVNDFVYIYRHVLNIFLLIITYIFILFFHIIDIKS